MFVNSHNDRLVVSGSSFQSCSSYYRGGGAIHVDMMNNDLLVESSNFSECRSYKNFVDGATTDGGGAIMLYQNNSNPTVTECVFVRVDLF